MGGRKPSDTMNERKCNYKKGILRKEGNIVAPDTVGCLSVGVSHSPFARTVCCPSKV